jgi:hypothetical protein
MRVEVEDFLAGYHNPVESNVVNVVLREGDLMIAAREKCSIAENIMECTTTENNILGVFKEDCPISLGVEVDAEIKVEIQRRGL